MDVLVGRYADARLDAWAPDALHHFERFLALPDPMLQTWLFSGTGYGDGEFRELIDDIRVFHGLADEKS